MSTFVTEQQTGVINPSAAVFCGGVLLALLDNTHHSHITPTTINGSTKIVPNDF